MADQEDIEHIYDKRFGVAFSGGGIRSASFCSGVLCGIIHSEQMAARKRFEPPIRAPVAPATEKAPGVSVVSTEGPSTKTVDQEERLVSSTKEEKSELQHLPSLESSSVQAEGDKGESVIKTELTEKGDAGNQDHSVVAAAAPAQEHAEHGEHAYLPRGVLPKFFSSVSGGGYVASSFLMWARRRRNENPKVWAARYFRRLYSHAGYYVRFTGCSPRQLVAGFFDLLYQLTLIPAMIALTWLVQLPWAYPCAGVFYLFLGDHYDRYSSLGIFLGVTAAIFFVAGTFACFFNFCNEIWQGRGTRTCYELTYLVSTGASVVFIFFGTAVFIKFIEIGSKKLCHDTQTLWSPCTAFGMCIFGAVVLFLLIGIKFPVFLKLLAGCVCLFLFGDIIHWRLSHGASAFLGLAYTPENWEKFAWGCTILFFLYPILATVHQTAVHDYSKWRLRRAFYYEDEESETIWTCCWRSYGAGDNDDLEEFVLPSNRPAECPPLVIGSKRQYEVNDWCFTEWDASTDYKVYDLLKKPKDQFVIPARVTAKVMVEQDGKQVQGYEVKPTWDVLPKRGLKLTFPDLPRRTVTKLMPSVGEVDASVFDPSRDHGLPTWFCCMTINQWRPVDPRGKFYSFKAGVFTWKREGRYTHEDHAFWSTEGTTHRFMGAVQDWDEMVLVKENRQQELEIDLGQKAGLITSYNAYNFTDLKLSEAMAISAAAGAYTMGAFSDGPGDAAGKALYFCGCHMGTNRGMRPVRFEFGWKMLLHCTFGLWLLLVRFSVWPFTNPREDGGRGESLAMITLAGLLAIVWTCVPGVAVQRALDSVAVCMKLEKILQLIPISQWAMMGSGQRVVPTQSYLSDGGHSENLGILPLLLRRMKYIVVCNGGADPQNLDLKMALRQAKTKLPGFKFYPLRADRARRRPEPEMDLEEWILEEEKLEKARVKEKYAGKVRRKYEKYVQKRRDSIDKSKKDEDKRQRKREPQTNKDGNGPKDVVVEMSSIPAANPGPSPSGASSMELGLSSGATSLGLASTATTVTGLSSGATLFSPMSSPNGALFSPMASPSVALLSPMASPAAAPRDSGEPEIVIESMDGEKPNRKPSNPEYEGRRRKTKHEEMLDEELNAGDGNLDPDVLPQIINDKIAATEDDHDVRLELDDAAAMGGVRGLAAKFVQTVDSVATKFNDVAIADPGLKDMVVGAEVTDGHSAKDAAELELITSFAEAFHLTEPADHITARQGIEDGLPALLKDITDFSNDSNHRCMVFKVVYPTLPYNDDETSNLGIATPDNPAPEVGYVFVLHPSDIPADLDDICANHVDPAQTDDPYGMCCNCCSTSRLCGGCTMGEFPFTSTGHQYFTPAFFSAYHKQGFAAVKEAFSLDLLNLDKDVPAPFHKAVRELDQNILAEDNVFDELAMQDIKEADRLEKERVHQARARRMVRKRQRKTQVSTNV